VSISVTKLLPLISVQRRGEGTDGRAHAISSTLRCHRQAGDICDLSVGHPSSSRRMRRNRRANDALLRRQRGKLFFRELACTH